MGRRTQDLIIVSMFPWMLACLYVSIWFPLPKMVWLCIAIGPHCLLMPIACFYALTREESIPPLIRETPVKHESFPRSFRGPSDIEALDTILRDAVLRQDGFLFDGESKRFTLEFWQRDLRRQVFHRLFWPIYTEATPFRKYRLDFENVRSMTTKCSEPLIDGDYSLAGISSEAGFLVIGSHYCLDEIRLESADLFGILNDLGEANESEIETPCRTVLLVS